MSRTVELYMNLLKGESPGFRKILLRNAKTKTMQKSQTKRGRAQDRRLVSGKQKHEVAHVARQSGKSASTVKAAIKIHGHSRKKLMDALEEIREILNMILPPKTKGAKKKK